jgi:hypothetical protein
MRLLAQQESQHFSLEQRFPLSVSPSLRIQRPGRDRHGLRLSAHRRRYEATMLPSASEPASLLLWRFPSRRACAAPKSLMNLC